MNDVLWSHASQPELAWAQVERRRFGRVGHMAKPLEIFLPRYSDVRPSSGPLVDLARRRRGVLVGGLLQIVYFGAGPMSIDASRNESQP